MFRINFSNIISLEDKCLRKKFGCLIKYFGAFFLFARSMDFLWWYTDGRKEGNVRTRGSPVSVHEKLTRWIYHFFLAMVLR